MGAFPTYAYDDDGKVVAFHGTHVITSGTDFEKVSETAEQYFEALRQEHSKQAADEARKTATHITTPNGDKGVILGRVASLWADEITVRFANGQIRRYATFVGDDLKYSAEEAGVPQSPVEHFQHKLDQTTVTSREGLTERLGTLEEIRKSASHLASQGVSYADGLALDRIVLTADAERNEVRDALAHLEAVDAEAIAPPKLGYVAVEQADLGPSGDWLEVTAQEMIAESEAQDFDKLLTEGPTEFLSSLDIAALAHTGTIREMAIEHVHAKTAGFQGEAVENYRDEFVANCELARKRELSYRQDGIKKTAKKTAKEVKNVPDEAIFL